MTITIHLPWWQIATYLLIGVVAVWLAAAIERRIGGATWRSALWPAFGGLREFPVLVTLLILLWPLFLAFALVDWIFNFGSTRYECEYCGVWIGARRLGSRQLRILKANRHIRKSHPDQWPEFIQRRKEIRANLKQIEREVSRG